MMLKNCNNCNIEKPTAEFYQMKHCYLGVSNICKECFKERNRQHYLDNSDRYKSNAKKWAKNNIEKRKAIVKKSDDKYRDLKRKKNNERQKQKRIINPERERLISRQAAHLRRIRLSSVKKTATLEGIKKLLKRADGYCLYCGFKNDKLTLDHIDPISKGGNHSINNLIPCCKSCNSKKATRVFEDWLYDAYGTNGVGRVLAFLERRSFKKYLPNPKVKHLPDKKEADVI